MKGVILAGGNATRLYPNTKVTNKHLLPVYNQPMIYYPIQTLQKAGIDDILILPGKNHAGDFARLLGSGKDFNAKFTYKVQDHAGGLAYAISLAKDFVGDDDFVVILGDNIIGDNIIEEVQNFKGGATIFLKQVQDPQRFGVAELEGSMIIGIEEKPENPKTDLAAIGVYIYDKKAFNYIETLKPSDRGELEVTDLNNIYIKKGQTKAAFLKDFWFDAGTHDSLVDAAYSLKNLNRPMEPLSLEQKNSPLVVVGASLYDNKDKTYLTSKYLPYFIESIKKQDYKNIKLVFVDNSDLEDNDNIKLIKDGLPEAKIIKTGYNSGFSKANNIIIKEAQELGADYFFAVNVDMILDSNVVSSLVSAVMRTPQVGSATCKVKKWDFSRKNNEDMGKTNFLDSTGITVNKEHRFIDRGHGDVDYGQFDQLGEVFGANGAVAIYRMSSLEDVVFKDENGNKEYFDELMFMYKEDVDISYRLQLAGYKCIYTPEAVVYHDRSLSGQGKGILGIVMGRINRNRKFKEWSWLNHHIMLNKVVDNGYSSKVKLSTLWYEIKSNVYILFFEPYLIRQRWELFKLRKEIKKRREQVKRRINIKTHIEKIISD